MTVPPTYFRWLDCANPPRCSVKVWGILEQIFDRQTEALCVFSPKKKEKRRA